MPSRPRITWTSHLPAIPLAGALSLQRLLPVLVMICCLFTGCARHYVITLTSGARITTLSKPKLKGPVYVFKDAKGQPAQVSAGRVREIVPASMAREEGSQFMK